MANGGVSIGQAESSDRSFSILEMTFERAHALGEEAREIARLVQASVRGFQGRVLHVRSDAMQELEAALAEAIAFSGAAAVRPLFPTSGASKVFEEEIEVPLEANGAQSAAELVARLRGALDTKPMRAAYGGSRAIPIRVIAIDDGPSGMATSVDPFDGDPDRVGVWRGQGLSYRVERKSGRVELEGEGLPVPLVESLADLVDRCQIVLGRPLAIEWATQRGKPVILSLRSFRPALDFAGVALRRVAVVAADEGTVAPLAIDALDRGLCRSDARVPGFVARRVYARPYRRLEVDGRLLGATMGQVSAATSAAAKVAYDAALAWNADSEFIRGAEEEAERARLADLDDLDDEALVRAFDERHATVAEAFRRLDGCRELTRRGIVALEVAVGPLPRECYPALSTPKQTKERVRIGLDLSDLARRIGPDIELEDCRSHLEPALARRWDELRVALQKVRPLGIDIVPDAIGASDATLRHALVTAPPRKRIDALEEARWNAMRRVLSLAHSQPYGAARAGVVSSVGLLLDRIVTTKGRLAELLASSLGLLREAALAIGRRLVDRGFLDSSSDAFYLTQAELEEALRGEPSGLAARVLARREDDERWRWFDAPRRLRDEPR